MNTKTKKLAAFSYFGGKSRYLDFILPLFPDHHHYVEPFAGSAVVLLNKKRSPVETINDLDKRIYNFFRVLRDSPEALIQKLNLTPYSRNEYRAGLFTSEDPIEDARRFFIRAQMNFGGSPSGNTRRKESIRFTAESRAGIAQKVNAMWVKVENLLEVANRLKECQIENRPALKLINGWDAPDTFFFCDPPYPHDSRTGSQDYEYEMSNDDHAKLAEKLSGIKGKAMVCGYPSETMSRLYSSWNRITGPARATQLGGKKSIDKIECVWINYSLNQSKLFV